MKQRYLSIDHAFLAVERQRLTDEGKDVAQVAAEFDALLAADLDADPGLHARAAALLDACAGLPDPRLATPYDDPSDLEAHPPRPDQTEYPRSGSSPIRATSTSSTACRARGWAAAPAACWASRSRAGDRPACGHS